MNRIPANKILLISHVGIAYALEIDVEESIMQHIHDCGGDIDGWDLEGADVAAESLVDGVLVASVKMIDDGPGDWPGSRETIAQLYDVRPATKEEWQASIKNEWPWSDGEHIVESWPRRPNSIFDLIGAHPLSFTESKIELPPGACPNCGGEGQEQGLDANALEGVYAKTCTACNGTGKASTP